MLITEPTRLAVINFPLPQVEFGENNTELYGEVSLNLYYKLDLDGVFSCLKGLPKRNTPIPAPPPTTPVLLK